MWLSNRGRQTGQSPTAAEAAAGPTGQSSLTFFYGLPDARGKYQKKGWRAFIKSQDKQFSFHFYLTIPDNDQGKDLS